MCGFIVAASVDEPIDRDRFLRARDSMRHRGPDAAGCELFLNDRVALGHRRLSIIDLSEAGIQPMRLGSLWVVFNGEIYNYPELRDELRGRGCRFQSHSDTEVLLHGYQVWGENLCERLEGMFAFAIYDQSSNKCFLARDHVGQKPLHYALNGKQFVAASEIKAIHSLLGGPFEVRQESYLDFLVYDYVPEPYTWFRSIRCLMPGHSMVVTLTDNHVSSRETKYWTFTPSIEPQTISSDDALSLIDHEIRRSVKSHMLADVEVGALLSGGIDSGSIVSVASSVSTSPLRTFSIGFNASVADELPRARLVAERYGTIHQESIVNEIDFEAGVDDVLDIFDQPFADTSLVPTRAVAAVASRSVKVVLTGDGGDETFGGYNLGRFISPFLNHNIWRKLRFDRGSANDIVDYVRDTLCYLLLSARQWDARAHYPQYSRSARREKRIIPHELRVQLDEYEYRWMYPQNTVVGLDAFRQAQWHHIKQILPGKMLAKIDRCSMVYSIEARAPYLSHRVIEAMLNLPTEVRNPKTGWYKGLLRTWATNRLPIQILSAPKRGFGIPKEWSALPPDASGMQVVERAVGRGFVSSAAWNDLQRKKKLLWKVRQIDAAIGRGLI